jgi:hypothetical protein
MPMGDIGALTGAAAVSANAEAEIATAPSTDRLIIRRTNPPLITDLALIDAFEFG